MHRIPEIKYFILLEQNFKSHDFKILLLNIIGKKKILI